MILSGNTKRIIKTRSKLNREQPALRGKTADLRRMEGATAEWYGRIVCLGVKDDLPIYKITSETRRPGNAPCESYVRLIANAMKNELGLGDDAMPEAVKNALQNS